MGIRKKISEANRKRSDKIMEKKLIKTDDDEIVVETLTSENDNSGINIKAVVQNMENPENMATVVENNITEIIEQDNVRSTLVFLNDDDVARILEENKEELKKQKKMKYAIDAITSNQKKLKVTRENLKSLTDMEVSDILNNLKPDKSEEAKNKTEEQKIKIVSMKIIEHLVKHGSVWHLDEMLRSLNEKSKLTVADLCITSINNYEKNKKGTISSTAKINFVTDLLKYTDIDYDKKINIMKDYQSNKVLKYEECTTIMDTLKKEKIEKDKKDLSEIEFLK